MVDFSEVILKIDYFSDLSSHTNKLLIDDGITLFETSGVYRESMIRQLPNKCDIFKLTLLNEPIVHEEGKRPNFVLRLLSVLIMIILFSLSSSPYEIDPRRYLTCCKIKIDGPRPSIVIKVADKTSKNKYDKAVISIKCIGCSILSRKTHCEVCKEYVTSSFQEYYKFNGLRTMFFTVLFSILSLMTIIFANYVSFVIFVALVILNVLLYFVSKKLLSKMEKEYLRLPDAFQDTLP